MNRAQRMLAIILSIMLTAMLITGCGSNDKYVNLVKTGTMQIAPNVVIGEAFNNFFESPKWKSFKSSDGQRIVEFTGKMRYNNKPAKAKIQFIIKSDTYFELGAVEINDVGLNKLESIAVVNKILTNPK